MDLVLLILGLCLVGFLVYLLTTKIPLPPVWRTAIQVIAAIVVILYLLRRFGGLLPNVLP
jgi:hypothetical protein